MLPCAGGLAVGAAATGSAASGRPAAAPPGPVALGNYAGPASYAGVVRQVPDGPGAGGPRTPGG